MAVESRRYRYVSPIAFLGWAVDPGNRGYPIGSVDDDTAWRATGSRDELSGPFGFVIDLPGCLSPQLSEHLACAGGTAVLSAGEIGFTEHGERWIDTDQ